MENVYKFFLVACICFITEGGISQNRFKAGAMVGINMSQIDGDKDEGYRQPGLLLGLNGGFFINPNFDISTQLLYNEKGAKPNPDAAPKPDFNYGNFSFKYSEIALLANFHYDANNAKNYYRQSIHVGFSYGRLFKSITVITRNNTPNLEFQDDLVSKYNPNDVSFILGWSYSFSPRWGLALRHTVSLNLMYDNPTYASIYRNEAFEHLRPYFLSCYVFYNFISPRNPLANRNKKKKKKVSDDPLEEL